MRPHIQTFFFNKGKYLFILLCKGRGKIPCPHHIYIIFFRADLCHFFRIFHLKLFIQIIPHQHTDSKPNGVSMFRLYPTINFLYKYIQILLYYFYREHIAGCPIIDIRKKTLQFSQTFLIILYLLYQKSV